MVVAATPLHAPPLLHDLIMLLSSPPEREATVLVQTAACATTRTLQFGMACAALQPFGSCATPQPLSQHPHQQHHHLQKEQQQQQELPFFGCLLRQLDALGWQLVAGLSQDLSQVTLALCDAAGRRHLAGVTLVPAKFPAAAPAVHMQLPAPLKVRWRPSDSLASLVTHIHKVLDSYQALWAQLEELDQHCQLLDPSAVLEQPYSHSSRCLALGNGASCQLQLATAAPTSLPSSVLFHGLSATVAELQSAWYGSAHRVWQATTSVRANLEAVLQLQLPPPKPGMRKGCAAVMAAGRVVAPTALQGSRAATGDAGSSQALQADSDGGSDDADDEPGACAICYALHLADPSAPNELGVAPSVTCAAGTCGRLMHARCLTEWLGALPDTRRVFDTLFGSCPFCHGPISVSTRM